MPENQRNRLVGGIKRLLRGVFHASPRYRSRFLSQRLINYLSYSDASRISCRAGQGIGPV